MIENAVRFIQVVAAFNPVTHLSVPIILQKTSLKGCIMSSVFLDRL